MIELEVGNSDINLDEKSTNSLNEATVGMYLRLTDEQKLGMITSVIKDKMDSQQLKSAVGEIKSILES